MFPAVMRSAASEAFNGVNWFFAAGGCGVVTQHVTPGALHKGRAIAAVDERNLPAKHVDTLFGGTLRDDVSVVNICNKDCGGRLPREDWVTLPVRRSTDEGFREAWVGDEGVE
jgi:hypothetical protein